MNQARNALACGHARLAPLAMTFGEHLAASVRGLPCAPPRH